MEVSAADHELIQHEDGCFKIGYRDFLDGCYCDRETALVLENAYSDGPFYDHLLKNVARASGLPNLKIDFVHGGGSETFRALQREIDRKRPSVCVVDSGRYTPYDQVSETCAKVLQTATNNAFVGSVQISIGRELENTIPFHILRSLETYSDYPDFELLQSILNNDQSEVGQDFWSFF